MIFKTLTFAALSLIIIFIDCQCHSSCLTCTGVLSTQCISCPDELYLSVTTCIPTCPVYTNPVVKECTSFCETGYFLNTINSYCESCKVGCTVCSSIDNCQQWEDGSDPQDFLRDNVALWIVLGMFLIGMVGLLVWLICCRKSQQAKSEQEAIDMMQQPKREEEDPQISNVEITENEQIIKERWLDDINQISPKQVVVNANHANLRQTAIEGIGISQNGSGSEDSGKQNERKQSNQQFFQ